MIKQKDLLSKRIDKRVQKADQIPKEIKRCEKELETTSGGLQKEQELIRRMKLLKESIPFIEERDAIEEQINAQYKAKKEATKNLPAIIRECKALQADAHTLVTDLGSLPQSVWDKTLEKVRILKD